MSKFLSFVFSCTLLFLAFYKSTFIVEVKYNKKETAVKNDEKLQYDSHGSHKTLQP